MHDKTEHVIRIRNLKIALNHGLVFKKVNGVIKFNQKAWLKSYIDMNSDLRKNKKKTLTKTFSNLWVIVLLEIPWEMLENMEISIL